MKIKNIREFREEAKEEIFESLNEFQVGNKIYYPKRRL